MKKQNKKAKQAINKTAAGAWFAAIAAAIATTYLLHGSKNTQKRRTQGKAWPRKARGEILKRLERISKIDEAAYHKIIAEVARKYKTLKRLDAKDVVEFAEELKGYWKDITHSVAPRPAKKAQKRK